MKTIVAVKSLSCLFICFLLVVSCTTSKSTASPEDLKVLKSLVSSRQFQIESNWAFPQPSAALQQVLNSGLMPSLNSSGSINLVGNANYLKFSNDSISSYLPFYGERRMNAGYGQNDGAIKLEGLIKNYMLTLEKDGSYTISFDAKSDSETYQVSLRLFPNLRTDMLLTGVYRAPIRYSGEVKRIEK